MRRTNAGFLVLVPMLLCVAAACDRGMSGAELHSHLDGRFKEHYVAPYAAGDTETWLRIFADDVVALHDGLPPLSGKEAIRGFGEVVSRNFEIDELDTVVDEVRREGNWAWTRGRFDALFVAKSADAPPGVAGARSGKFLLIWERQDNGEWLVIMDMGNSMQPPPGTSEQ